MNYKNISLRLLLLLLPPSWVMVPALTRMNSFAVWNVLRFFPLKCPLSYLFGIQCPTCGLSRSLVYAWNGNFSLSLHYHFLGLIIYFLSYVVFFWILFVFEFKKEFSLINWIQHKFSGLYKKIPRFVWIVLLITYSIWGFSRNPL